MSDSQDWTELRPAHISALAAVYEKASSQALRQARAMRGPRAAAASQLVETRRALRRALCDKLLDMGCPPDRIDDLASAVVIRAARGSGGAAKPDLARRATPEG